MRRNLQAKNIALLLVTGLVVSWVTHGLQTQWGSFSSWWLFFGSWLIHTLGIVVLVAVVGGAIVATHHFFIGSEHNGVHADLTSAPQQSMLGDITEVDSAMVIGHGVITFRIGVLANEFKCLARSKVFTGITAAINSGGRFMVQLCNPAS